jgi:hypothetical protein
VLGVVTALLTVATAYLGVQTAKIGKEKEQAQQAATVKGADATSLRGQVTSLQSKVTQLNDDNSTLQSQLANPTTVPAPTITTSPPGSVTVRHSGQLTITDPHGGSFDLDSPASDPQWLTGPADLDGRASGTTVTLNPGNGAERLNLGTKVADYNSCRNTTGYTPDGFRFSSELVASYICWKTDERRYSALRVLNVSSNSATFDIVTYDPPAST